MTIYSLDVLLSLWGACIFLNYSFIQVFPEVGCWTIHWQLYFWFSEEAPYCFPHIDFASLHSHNSVVGLPFLYTLSNILLFVDLLMMAILTSGLDTHPVSSQLYGSRAVDGPHGVARCIALGFKAQDLAQVGTMGLCQPASTILAASSGFSTFSLAEPGRAFGCKQQKFL